jgi:hypothetical protein
MFNLIEGILTTIYSSTGVFLVFFAGGLSEKRESLDFFFYFILFVAL